MNDRYAPREALRLGVVNDDYEPVGFVELMGVCDACEGWGYAVNAGKQEFEACPQDCDDGLTLANDGNAILELLRAYGVPK